MLLRLTLHRLPEKLTLCAPSQNQSIYLKTIPHSSKGERVQISVRESTPTIKNVRILAHIALASNPGKNHYA